MKQHTDRMLTLEDLLRARKAKQPTRRQTALLALWEALERSLESLGYDGRFEMPELLTIESDTNGNGSVRFAAEIYLDAQHDPARAPLAAVLSKKKYEDALK